MKAFALLIPLAFLALAPLPQGGGGQHRPPSIDNDDTGVLPFSPVSLLDVTFYADVALLHWSNGGYATTDAGTGHLLAEYGNPESVVHITWFSHGVEIEVDVRQQAGESELKFAERAKATVDAMKLVFPPDPPPHN